MRLRSLITINPPKSKLARLPADTEVTFAPMEALADGLGGLDTSQTRMLGDVTDGSYSYFAEGDVLLAKVTPCFENGKKAIAAGLLNGIGFATSEVHVIRPDTRRIDRGYLRYLLCSEDFRAAAMASMTGAGGLRRISEDSVRNFRLPVDNLNAQKKIAAFLDPETARIEELIVKREAFLTLIDEKESALAARAVSGAILGSAAGGARGWFGAVPGGWPVRRGKFLFKERQDRSKSGEEELLTVSHITGVTRRSDKDVNMFLAESMEGYKLVSPGDVVVNTMWAWMGAMGLSFLDGLISPSYNVYSPITDDFEPAYLDLLLRSRPFVAEANRRSKGVWSSRLRLYPDAFLDIRFPVPPRDTQGAILEALEAAIHRERHLADLSRRSLDRLRELRSALITAAVSGKFDMASWRKRDGTDRRLDRIEELAPLREARA